LIASKHIDVVALSEVELGYFEQLVVGPGAELLDDGETIRTLKSWSVITNGPARTLRTNNEIARVLLAGDQQALLGQRYAAVRALCRPAALVGFGDPPKRRLAGLGSWTLKQQMNKERAERSHITPFFGSMFGI
jgi:hypothetical protein